MEIHSLPFDIPLAVWENDMKEYMAAYTDILRELAETANSVNSDDAAKWFAKCLNYNVPGSTKQLFGPITAITYKSLVNKDQLTTENLKLAHYLGWCVELFHSVIYISDDVLDQSTTRRGQVCWYKLKEACFTTPTDVVMIENGIYKLLRRHFRHLDCYVSILELFHEMLFQSARGQLTDFLLSKKNVTTFNMETYNSVAMDKTGRNSVYLPAALALHLAGVKDPQIFKEYKSILTGIGHFCQVQNDYVDCYINSDITGKVGTDIQDNKCCWLAVVCMQRANPAQRAIMEECYGQNDPQKIARVRQLYEELNMPSFYAEFEKETYDKLKRLIELASNEIPKEIFFNILDFTVDDTKFLKSTK